MTSALRWLAILAIAAAARTAHAEPAAAAGRPALKIESSTSGTVSIAATHLAGPRCGPP